MTCQNCKNWNAKLLTCKLNPDVKRDKNNGCFEGSVIVSIGENTIREIPISSRFLCGLN